MGEVNEKSEAEVARLIKQQRERDDQVGLRPVIALRCLVCTVSWRTPADTEMCEKVHENAPL